ncbi:MAG: sensor histidine kinase [Longimicrobiales bacterium]
MPLKKETRTSLRRASIILGVALLLGAVAAGQDVISMGGENRWTFDHALIMETPYWVFWAALLPAVILIARGLPVTRRTAPLMIPLHVLIGLGMALLHYSTTMIFLGLIGHHNWSQTGQMFGVHFVMGLRYQLLSHLGGYVIVLGIVLGLEYYRKYRERELAASQLTAQLSQARLQALRMQLNPHFLFNAMNSIAMLVRKSENSRAVQMLAGLSDLLRYVLEDARTEEVPLREELHFIERYLEIERVRFQDRLRVKMDVAEEALEAMLPDLLLQPLVENAVRHGIARKVNPGTIEIAGRKLGDRLILQVRDDGPGLSDASRGTGVGLVNTRKRLEQSYDTEFSFELRNGPHGGAVATVSLPFHTTPLASASSSAA